ncbi:MAG: PQQ-binding-like beta-propeller repeat protein [Verrucomicrobiota bacterium]
MHFLNKLVALSLASAWSTCCLTDDLYAGDWLGFLGSSGDGFSFDVPEEWHEPKLIWKTNVAGECYGGIAVKDQYVVVTDHAEDGSKDFFLCVDAATGKELWKVEVANGKEMDFGASPRANPLILDELVYLVNAFGKVIAVQLADGKKVWEVDLVEDYGGKVPIWGYCASPIVAGGNLILMAGGEEGLIALNPKTGLDVWISECYDANYAGFLVEKFAGVEQIIGFDIKTLRGWSPKDGKELWKLDLESPNGYIVPAPVKLKDKLLLVDDYHSARVYDFDAKGKIIDKVVLEGEDYSSELATPLVVGDLVYFSSYNLACADADTLKTHWPLDMESNFEKEPFNSEMMTFITNGTQLLVFTQEGKLILLPVSKEEPKVLGMAQLTEETQALPALSGKHFFVRDKERLYCYQLKP